MLLCWLGTVELTLLQMMKAWSVPYDNDSSPIRLAALPSPGLSGLHVGEGRKSEIGVRHTYLVTSTDAMKASLILKLGRCWCECLLGLNHQQRLGACRLVYVHNLIANMEFLLNHSLSFCHLIWPFSIRHPYEKYPKLSAGALETLVRECGVS